MATLSHPEMNRFIYNNAHCCFLGENLFFVDDGKFDLGLRQEFPVQEGQLLTNMRIWGNFNS